MTTPRFTRTVGVAFYGPVTLADLRQLVEAAAELGDDASVSVKTYSDQREGSSVSFEIRAKQ